MKKVTSLLLFTNILNALCASARVFPAEQEKSMIFFYYFVDRLGFFIICVSVLLMPLLTLKTPGLLFKILEFNDINPC